MTVLLPGVASGALVLAFVITLIEMTEVAVLVLALGAEETALRQAAGGAVAGTAVVAVVALLVGRAVSAVPSQWLLVASAIVLVGFGVFLFRSTLRTYRQSRALSTGGPPAVRRPPVVPFAGGITVGAVAGGAVLVVAVVLLHERIRRLKTAWLKLGATALIFTYAVFWAGEAVGVAWPFSDLFLIPLFVLAVLVLRGIIALFVRRSAPSASAPR